jgi:hypothetical protein
MASSDPALSNTRRRRQHHCSCERPLGVGRWQGAPWSPGPMASPGSEDGGAAGRRPERWERTAPGDRDHRLSRYCGSSRTGQHRPGPGPPPHEVCLEGPPSAISDRLATMARLPQVSLDNAAGQRIEGGFGMRSDQVEAWDRWAGAGDRVELPHGGAQRTRQRLPRGGSAGEQQRSWRGGMAGRHERMLDGERDLHCPGGHRGSCGRAVRMPARPRPLEPFVPCRRVLPEPPFDRSRQPDHPPSNRPRQWRPPFHDARLGWLGHG